MGFDEHLIRLSVLKIKALVEELPSFVDYRYKNKTI